MVLIVAKNETGIHFHGFSQLPPGEALEQVKEIVESEGDNIIAEDVAAATEICLELASVAAQDPEVCTYLPLT